MTFATLPTMPGVLCRGLLLAIRSARALWPGGTVPKHHNVRRRSRHLSQGCRLGGDSSNPALNRTLRSHPCAEAPACGTTVVAPRTWPRRHHRQLPKTGFWFDSTRLKGIRQICPETGCSPIQALWQRCASNGLSPCQDATILGMPVPAAKSAAGSARSRSAIRRRPRAYRFVRKAAIRPPPRPVHGHRQHNAEVMSSPEPNSSNLRRPPPPVRSSASPRSAALMSRPKLSGHGIPSHVSLTSLGQRSTTPAQLSATIAWSHHIDHVWTPQVCGALWRDSGLQDPGQGQNRRSLQTLLFSMLQRRPPLVEIQSPAPTETLRECLFVVLAVFDVTSAGSKGTRPVALRLNRRDPGAQPGHRGSGAMRTCCGATCWACLFNSHWEELSTFVEMEACVFPRSHCKGILESQLQHYNCFSTGPRIFRPFELYPSEAPNRGILSSVQPSSFRSSSFIYQIPAIRSSHRSSPWLRVGYRTSP